MEKDSFQEFVTSPIRAFDGFVKLSELYMWVSVTNRLKTFIYEKEKWRNTQINNNFLEHGAAY